MDALRFIRAFTPIISKAAMQTYYSALPLMPSDSLLSQHYSVMSRPGLKSSGSVYSLIKSLRLRIKFSIRGEDREVYDSTIFGEIIALSFRGEIAFFDTRTGNEIGSRISTPNNSIRLVSFSPDGQWLVTRPWGYGHALDVWNVQTRTHTKTIQEGSGNVFKRIKYSAGGERFMVIHDSNQTIHGSVIHNSNSSVFILDTKTDQPLKQLEFGRSITDVAISPDGSQIAFGDELGIKIIDVSTGHSIDRQLTPYNDSLWHSTPRLAWSPNGQFLASTLTSKSISMKPFSTRTGIYLLSLTPSAQVPSLSLLGSFTTDHVFHLAFSPDSSKLVVVLWDGKENSERAILSIWCTRSASLAGIVHFNWSSEQKTKISFSADGRDILLLGHYRWDATLIRFSVVPTHLETYIDRPPKFHPSQIPHTTEYSHHISGGAIDDYDSYVDANGWILNTKGEREIWTPWANFEVLCSCQPPQKGQTQYRTLRVQDPETKTVVLIYVVSFEQRDVNNGIQEAVAFSRPV